MNLTSNWFGYIDRSYSQIKTSILAKLALKNPQLTDYSESNPLIILIDCFSALGELINVYIDNMARESFLYTARNFDSVVNLTRLIDYRIKARYPSTGVVTLTTLDNVGDLFNLTSDFLINKGWQIKSKGGLLFVSTKDVIFKQGTSSVDIPVKQITHLTGQILGVTTSDPNQGYILGTKYVQDSITLTINGQVWDLVPSFARSGANDKHFIVEIGSDGIAFILFGDGTFGDIPPSGYNIIAEFDITEATDAGVNTVTEIQTTLTIPGVTTYKATNIRNTSGASFYETTEEIRSNAPKSLRTLERAVTYQDFKDLLKLASGVGKSDLKFCCGKTIDSFISPITKGIAELPLIDDTAEYLDKVKMVGSNVNVIPAGITELYVELDVYPKFRANKNQTIADVQTILLDKFSYENSDINRRITVSDVVAPVDDLQRVDNVDLIKLRTIPYATPKNHLVQLNWQIEVKDNSLDLVKWMLQSSSGGFKLFMGSKFITTLALNTWYLDPKGIIRLRIFSGVYTNGMIWTFKTYPNDKTIDFNDNTVPVLSAPNIIINIKDIPVKRAC